MIGPSPALIERVSSQRGEARSISIPRRGPRGFNDFVHRPDQMQQVDGNVQTVPRLRGALNVFVALVNFTDVSLKNSAEHFDELLFDASEGSNSATNYFKEVSNDLVSLKGKVVGPYTLPNPISYYAGSGNGTQARSPNAPTMAYEVANLVKNEFSSAYDNDSDGFIDSFIVIHAGSGAEETGNRSDIWSHKWVMEDPVTANGVTAYSYLTIPDDAQLGVCVHEIGHLIFGMPDLYGEDLIPGLGDFCVMAGGSWGGFPSGSKPCHPNIVLKSIQGWSQLSTTHEKLNVQISDAKQDKAIGYKMAMEGQPSSRYFVAENRQKSGYDESLPGSGVLVYRVDETKYDRGNYTDNPNEFFMTLIPADNSSDYVTAGGGRSTAGTPYPGRTNNTALDNSSTPSTKYYGSSTGVGITDISSSLSKMTADIAAKNSFGRGSEAPGMTCLNSELFAAYRDENNSNSLMVARSTNGTDWDTFRASGQRASDGVEIFSFLEKVFMVYRGNESDSLYLTSSRNGIRWNTIKEIGWACNERPSAAVLGDELFIAFRKKNEEEITVLRSFNGETFTESTVNDAKSGSGVSLVVLDGRLFMAFLPTNGTGHIQIVSTKDTSTWTLSEALDHNSRERPTLVSFEGSLRLMYIDRDDEALHVAKSKTGESWENLWNDSLTKIPVRAAVGDMPGVEGLVTTMYINYLPRGGEDFRMLRTVGN